MILIFLSNSFSIIISNHEKRECFEIRSGKFDFTGSEETHAQQDQAVPKT